MHPGVIGHSQPFSMHLSHVPPSPNLLVPVHGTQEALQLPIAPGRSTNLRLSDRLSWRLTTGTLRIRRGNGLLTHETHRRKAAPAPPGKNMEPIPRSDAG